MVAQFARVEGVPAFHDVSLLFFFFWRGGEWRLLFFGAELRRVQVLWFGRHVEPLQLVFVFGFLLVYLDRDYNTYLA